MAQELGIVRPIKTIPDSGVGYVVIPENAERSDYIDDCYRTNTLTIWGGMGCGTFTNIKVLDGVMQNIEFPEDKDKLNRGSTVLWIKDNNSQVPVVIGTLRVQEDFFQMAERQYRIVRALGGRNVEVFLDGNTASLYVNITGDKENAADINVKVTSENKDSEINVYSDGVVNVASSNINIESDNIFDLKIKKEGVVKGQIRYELENGFSVLSEEAVNLVVRNNDDEGKVKIGYKLDEGMMYEDEYKNKVTLSDGEIDVKVDDNKAEFKYKRDEGFEYKDQFNNEIVCKNGEIDITSQTIKHNNGGEPMVKGDTLKNLLENLCQQVNDLCTAAMAITVTCGMPGAPSTPPVNAAQFASIQGQVNSIKGQLQNALSQQSKLD